MPDEAQTPGQQVETPGQQVSSNPGSAPVDWEARYKGSVATIERLTLENRSLKSELDTKTSDLEQLRIQLGQKDTEHQVAVVERDRQLQTITQAKAQAESELTELRALKLKVDVATELGRPELLKIAQRIPNVTDHEALKAIMTDFVGFADSMVHEREKQLLNGITPSVSSVGQAPSAPSSRDAWLSKINSLPLGSPERAKAFDDYGDWLEKTHAQ
jgi:hypothetical protein